MEDNAAKLTTIIDYLDSIRNAQDVNVVLVSFLIGLFAAFIVFYFLKR